MHLCPSPIPSLSDRWFDRAQIHPPLVRSYGSRLQPLVEASDRTSGGICPVTTELNAPLHCNSSLVHQETLDHRGNLGIVGCGSDGVMMPDTSGLEPDLAAKVE